jgi:L-malate glycosyltransferase
VTQQLENTRTAPVRDMGSGVRVSAPPRPMAITFVLPAYPRDPSGGVRVVFELSNRLAARGHRVTIVSTRQRSRPGRPRTSWSRALLLHARNVAGRFRDQYIWDRRVDWTNVDRRVRLAFVPRLTASHIPEADAVIATAWWTMGYVNDYPPSKGRKYYLIQAYEAWDGPAEMIDATWRMAARKVVIAPWLYERALQMGVDPGEIALVPVAIDHARFRLRQPIDARPARVAMLYHPDPRKRTAVGIDALELARSLHPGLSAVMFGTGRRPRSLPAWIEYQRAPADLPGTFNGAAVYMCPSASEGWHLPPAEAMACGCALVTTDIPGVGDYARHDDTARLVPVDDARMLANEVVDLLAHPQERLRLAAAGLCEVAPYTWDRSVRELEAWLNI